MKKEKNDDNNCSIYSIFFGNDSEENKEAKIILNNIAKLGGTNQFYNSDNLCKLCESFLKISEAIQTNFRLKLNPIYKK